MSSIDEQIAQLESQIKALKLFKDVMANPALREVVLLALKSDSLPGNQAAIAHVLPDTDGEQVSIYGKISAFFKGRNNRPATISEICEAIGHKRGSVGQVVFKRSREKFERSGHAGGNAPATYWLTEEAFKLK